eukprot:140398-Pelagomonas_calceolata.AAC.1
MQFTCLLKFCSKKQNFLLWSFAISNLFMVKILKPKPWWLAVFVFQGMVLGLGASFWYYFNKKRKAEICGVVRVALAGT